MPRNEHDPQHELAERIRQALIQTAQDAHEDAGIRGLCCEGAWEAAINALRRVDLAPILASHSPASHSPATPPESKKPT